MISRPLRSRCSLQRLTRVALDSERRCALTFAIACSTLRLRQNVSIVTILCYYDRALLPIWFIQDRTSPIFFVSHNTQLREV